MAGIIVDEIDSGVRHAISEVNFNDKTQTRVRELKPGETILGYKPRARQERGDSESTPGAAGDPSDSEPSEDETPVLFSGDFSDDNPEDASPDAALGDK